MKALTSLIAIAFAATVSTAYAADDNPAAEKQPSAQRSKMKSCNTEAKDKALKGDDRKAFMRECLSAKPEKVSQQDKMKNCNAEAKDKALKGDERKSFMSSCLKGSKA